MKKFIVLCIVWLYILGIAIIATSCRRQEPIATLDTDSENYTVLMWEDSSYDTTEAAK